MSIDGLWRDKERNALIRIHRSRPAKDSHESRDQYLAHLEFLKGWASTVYGQRRNVIEYESLMPKRDFRIRVTNWKTTGQSRNGYEYSVLCYVLTTILDDFTFDVPLKEVVIKADTSKADASLRDLYKHLKEIWEP